MQTEKRSPTVRNGVNSGYFSGGKYVYEKIFHVDEVDLGKSFVLHFEGVYHNSRVLINGALAGTHRYGYTAFDIDITDFVEMGKENIITVCAIDTHPKGKASGKQSKNYYSMGCDYTRTTGIWQTVWFEYVETNYIKSVKYYTSIEQKNVQIEVETVGNAKFTAKATYKNK